MTRSPIDSRMAAFHISAGVTLGPNASVSPTPAASNSSRVRRHFSHSPQLTHGPVLAGQTRANNAIVPLGAGGTLAVVSAAPTHLILDVNGYFE